MQIYSMRLTVSSTKQLTSVYGIRLLKLAVTYTNLNYKDISMPQRPFYH